MKGLVSLVKTMRASEKRLLLHHYSRETNAEQKMRLKLFKLINKGVFTDVEAKEKLNKSVSPSAYSHLKSRLKDDILNVLLMQDTSKRLAQPNRAAELDCRKKVAQSHLLLLRGARVEGMKLLQSAMKTANKYELLAERLQMHHLLREKFLGTGSSLELNRLNTEITNDLKQYEALLFAEEKSFVLSSPEFAKSLKSRSKDKRNLELIEELKKLFKKHKLARIGFWYYMAATEFYSAQGNYNDVVQLGLKFLKLVKESPAVKSKNNIAGVNMTVGVAQLQLGNFEKAKTHFLESSQLFPSAGFNRLTTLQFLVQTETAMREFQNANTRVSAALSHPRIELREFLKPRWLYLKSCVEFMSGDVEASFKSLNQDVYLLKQVDEWNVQFRLLEMMQLVEMKDEEWLEFKVDTTRKFLNRHKELITGRTKIAVEVFVSLLRNGQNFDSLSDGLKEKLEDCIDGKNDLVWKPTGPELVRFDLWVKSKMTHSAEAE